MIWWKGWFDLKQLMNGHRKEWVLNESLSWSSINFNLPSSLSWVPKTYAQNRLYAILLVTFINKESMQTNKILLLTGDKTLFYLPKFKRNLVASQSSKIKMYFKKNFETQKLQNENEFPWNPVASIFPTKNRRLLPVKHCGATLGTLLRARAESWLCPRWLRLSYT